MGEWQPSLPAGIWGRACVAHLGSGGAKIGFVLLPRGGRPQFSHCLSDCLPGPFSLGHLTPLFVPLMEPHTLRALSRRLSAVL